MTSDLPRILYIGWANHIHFQRWVEYFAGAGFLAWVLPITPAQPVVMPGVRVLHFHSQGHRLALQRAELRFWRWLHRFDLVHVQWAGFAELPMAARMHPYVVTAWGSDIYGFNEKDQATRRRLSQALREAALVTVDSEDLRRAVMTLGVDPGRVKVVQWGVDTALFRPDIDTAAMRARLDLGSGPVVYSPRNIAPVYNNDIILEAFTRVLGEFPTATLVQKHYKRIPETLAAWQRRADELGISARVRLMGDMPYEELPALYAMADVAVSVPSSDATPVSMLEAMACGAYPIASDLPSLREWITDGKNGCLVPIRDAKALAERIIRTLQAGGGTGAVRLGNRQLVMDRAEHARNMEAMDGYYRQIIAAG